MTSTPEHLPTSAERQSPVANGEAKNDLPIDTTAPEPTASGEEKMEDVDLEGELASVQLRQRIARASNDEKNPEAAFTRSKRGSILVGQRSLNMMAMEDPGSTGPRFVMFIIRQYRSWGYFIAEHDWKAIVICLLISAIGLYKVVLTPQQNDVTGYTPRGARSREEYTRYQEFFSQDGLGMTVYVFAMAKDGGSMLRGAHLNETLKVLDYATKNVTLFDDGKGRRLSFSEFCVSFCNINEPVIQFANGFNHQSQRVERDEPMNERINLTYPISNFFGTNLTLQQNFFGVEFYHGEDIVKILNTSAAEAAFLRDPANREAVAHLSAFLVETFEGNNPAPGNESVSSGHSTAQKQITNMKAAKIVVLQLRAAYQPGWTRSSVKKYEMDLVEAIEEHYKTEHLKLNVLAQSFVEEEMVKAGIALLPYLSVGFLIMLICAVVSVVSRALYMHQHSAPKIILAFAACMLPFMSCAAALGLLFSFGIRFSSILCVIPFLVLSIGVDSSYLMIHEWQRVIKHCRDHPNRRNANVGYRISEVLSEVGPAVLISTLTNILADGVGAFTSAPEITLLCVGNLVSMVVAFFFQMTFYAGLMSMVGRYEVANERKERRELQASMRAAQVAGASSPHRQLTRQHSKFHDNTKHALSRSMHIYVSFVSRKVVALGTIGLYLLYLGISIWGITRIDINLTTQKLFTQDSPLLALDKFRVKYQVPVFTQATVFVNRPGNLSDPKQLKRMNNFVEDMERISGQGFGPWGPVGSLYFVRDFLAYESSIAAEGSFDESASLLQGAPPKIASATTPTALLQQANETTNSSRRARQINGPSAGSALTIPPTQFNEDDLRNFISWPEYTYFSGFIHFNDSSNRLKKFFFTTGYFGKELSVWTKRGELLEKWRDIVDKHNAPNASEGFEGFESSVFHEDAIFLDLIDSIPSNTWQSVLATLICMAAVCFLFLNSLFTVVISASCVLSICVGILGILSWWHIDLDPISMAAMIISIGFSVDIPAHVSYHYYQASMTVFNASPELKLVNCLSSVAFPALQAALSTILCVLSLALVPIYMAEVFVKTMVLCVVLCNLHGLVFLPAFLIMFDSSVRLIRHLSEQARMRRKVGVDDGGKNKSALPSKTPPTTIGSSIAGSSSSSGSNSSNKSEPAHTHVPHVARNRRDAKPLPISTSMVCDRPPLEFQD